MEIRYMRTLKLERKQGRYLQKYTEIIFLYIKCKYKFFRFSIYPRISLKYDMQYFEGYK